MIDLDAIIEASHSLEPLSPTVLRLASLIADTSSGLDEVISVVSEDPTVTGQLMRTANSARFGVRGEVGTIDDAVVRIGASMTLEVVTESTVRKSADRPVAEYGLDEGAFWFHCRAASMAADLARRTFRKPTIPAIAPTAALLHDIGKLTLAQFLNDAILRTLAEAREQGGLSEIDAEQEVLGTNHAEVGGLIAQHWGLPEPFRTGITFHHAPADDESVLASMIHVADAAAKCGSEPTERQPEVDQGALERVDLTTAQFGELCELVMSAMSGTADLA